MKNNLTLLLLFVACLSFTAFGTDSLPYNEYVQKCYYGKEGFLGFNLSNGDHCFDPVRPDSLGKVLLSYSPESVQWFKRYKALDVIGGILTIIGTVAVIECPYALYRGNKSNVPFVLFGGGFACILAGVPIQFSALNARHKFLWTFNRDLLLHYDPKIKK